MKGVADNYLLAKFWMEFASHRGLRVGDEMEPIDTPMAAHANCTCLAPLAHRGILDPKIPLAYAICKCLAPLAFFIF